MSTARTAVLSILVACWIVGLFNQFHAWNTTAAYLIISMLNLRFEICLFYAICSDMSL